MMMVEGSGMRAIKKAAGGVTLVVLALVLAALPQRAASPAPRNLEGGSLPQSAADEPTPAFHAQAPKDALPATMDPSLFAQPVVSNAYTVAARIKKVLYQEPCYCHCDRSQGHGSLLDCFVSKHGSGCNICMSEDLYAYEQTRKGKTPTQIREAIVKGEWQSVDLQKYASPLPLK
jgi:Protein of unknown function with PCYCGC motif